MDKSGLSPRLPTPPGTRLADKHLGAALQEEALAPKLVHSKDADKGGADVDGADDHGVQQGGLTGSAKAGEEDRHVELQGGGGQRRSES